MGSSSSKASASCGASSGLSSSRSFRNARSKGHRGFRSYCLGTTSGSHDSDNEDEVSVHQNKGNGRDDSYIKDGTEADSDEMKSKFFRKAKFDKSDKMTFTDSNNENNEWKQACVTDTSSRNGGSRAASTQSLNCSSRVLSRFSLIPGNVSFRLSRTASLGSSRSCPVSSASLAVMNNQDELHMHAGPPCSLFDRNESQQCNNVLPVSLVNSIPSQYCEDTTHNTRLNRPTSSSVDNLQDDQTISSMQDEVRAGVGAGNVMDAGLCSPRIHIETDSARARQSDRRIGAREPVERNVRFSRTLSVGRLRDRVLRRSTLSDMTFYPVQQEREVRDANQGSGRQAWEGELRVSPSDGNALNSLDTSGYPLPSMSGSLFSVPDYEIETPRSREGRYQDLLEHRSNFLERRRRIRSQVRALQRLGSRFENLSGHDRSCILSGQHRTGRCTCRIISRNATLNDDNNAGASISRIVMLAEALFEVLDEIHQQSVVLSTRPSVSSIGSVPAPNEVVESLPVKLYNKLQKHQEEAAQCYICLVEYEDGDCMRILPCHHEFHRTCIDKWLKEIHRVCPLCRGDICRPDSVASEN